MNGDEHDPYPENQSIWDEHDPDRLLLFAEDIIEKEAVLRGCSSIGRAILLQGKG
jgi:hypothetical protein